MPVWKEGKATLQQKYNFTPTGPHNTYKVQGPFKFVIAMPNEMSNGYLVEKTVHPYLAGSLAISAVPDIGKYVNPFVSTTRHPEVFLHVPNHPNDMQRFPSQTQLFGITYSPDQIVAPRWYKKHTLQFLDSQHLIVWPQACT